VRATEGYLCGTCGKTPTDKTSKKKIGKKKRRRKKTKRLLLLKKKTPPPFFWKSTFVICHLFFPPQRNLETGRVKKKKKKKKKKNLMMCTTFTTTTNTTAWLGVTPRRPHRGATTGNANGRRVASNSSSNSNGKALSLQQIKVDKNRNRDEFQNWPVWGCEASTFPWTYGSTEQCYILKGRVIVTPDGASEGVTLEAGDFAEMEKGLSCTWDVIEDISKCYKFV
jgi:uncharacterized cupin superfamily protein